MSNAAETQSNFFQKYVFQTAPIVRVDEAPERNFCYLSHHVSERLANGDWHPIGEPGQEVYLERGTDNVLTFTGAYSISDGLGLEVIAKLPYSLRQYRGHDGYFKQSTLGDGPFLYQEMEYSRSQLIKLYDHLRPDRVAVTYPTQAADTVSFHEAGDTYGEWRQVFVMSLETLLQQQYAGLVVTLYRARLNVDQVLPPLTQQPLLVGFQTTGPELLQNLSQLTHGTEKTGWTDEQLRDVLTPREFRFHLEAPQPAFAADSWLAN